MYKIRIEFEVEPGNIKVDPETMSVWIDNDGNWEVFENVDQVMIAVGNGLENEFIMRKLPESQRQVIKIGSDKTQPQQSTLLKG